jgi:uncharacterized protein (TIGR04255 family)
MRPLPEYRKPPVVEVAIGLHFRPLPGFKTAHYGSFWALQKDSYPKVEDQAPILESLPAELVALPPLRRVFLQHADGTYLVQLQPDLFVFNWRKIPPTVVYPRFVEITKRFRDAWGSFRTYVEDNNLGPFEFTRYDVTYVNQIVESAGAFPLALEQYSPLIRVRTQSEEHFLPDPIGLVADVQFKIPEEKGILRVSFSHGTNPGSKEDVMQMQVIAQSNAKPDGSDLNEWLEVAHTWIVRGFTDLTSKEAHEQWGRIA